MLKILFLLAAASAVRVSEIHSLCIDGPFLIQNPRSFHLATNPAFLPKTSMEVSLGNSLPFTQSLLALWRVFCGFIFIALRIPIVRVRAGRSAPYRNDGIVPL